MDIEAYQAKEAHRQCVEHMVIAARYRKERDTLIRRLYGAGSYSYVRLAKVVGCSSELVAKVIQGRQ